MASTSSRAAFPQASPATAHPANSTTRTQDSVPDNRTKTQPSRTCCPLFIACSFVLSGCMFLAHVLAYQLIGRLVGHWCRPPDNLRLLMPEVWRNVAIPLLPYGTFSGCTVYDPLWR
ncbi:hypothetical protein HPB48_021943 [Haemaphysalis longicornis]|uniref:Uncharacterized protein n=1 Tax=Haemaphysalis longicornis TaxID=44386 RepID=A0A9J6GP07_HAELO|nr:hypothetical protein HPB48_021943 [Haemaphysalis longicornis]